MAAGVEPSPEACALARSRGVDARAGTLVEVELEPDSFDAVVFRQSLEHVNDPLADLRRAYTALREEGVLVVSVPNFGCWQRRRFGSHWFHLDLPRHRFHFDAAALRRTLASAGFEDVQTFTSSSTAGLPASIQYMAAGRCLFPGGLRLRVAAAACVLTLPASWMLARVAGAGDVLHAVARRPAQRPPRPLSETGTETVSRSIGLPAKAGSGTA
jgi:SAM-dependent methyltransferase